MNLSSQSPKYAWKSYGPINFNKTFATMVINDWFDIFDLNGGVKIAYIALQNPAINQHDYEFRMTVDTIVDVEAFSIPDGADAMLYFLLADRTNTYHQLIATQTETSLGHIMHSIAAAGADAWDYYIGLLIEGHAIKLEARTTEAVVDQDLMVDYLRWSLEPV